jgi:methyltransferase (TIGR00027 family)
VLSGARAQASCRSRYAEARLADSVRRGVTLYVILGVGLDSFAYRSALAAEVSVFEVDHPATQRWKRQRLSAALIPVPDGATFVPVGLRNRLADRSMVEHGLDLSRPALVSWLGVTMYLTRAAISQTLGQIGGFAPGTEIIADYMLPARLRNADGNTYAELIMPAAAGRGEPWLTLLGPDDMSALLAGHGFDVAEQVRQRDAVDAACGTGPTPCARPSLPSSLARPSPDAADSRRA